MGEQDVRSPASGADQRLLKQVLDEGLTVTPTQLERWRGLGLLPRARVVRETFGGSSVLDHDETVLAACRVIANMSRPGRPWHYAALELFQDGLPLSTAATRHAAERLLAGQLRPFRTAWDEAHAGAEPSGDDPIEWIADVASEASRRVGTNVRRAVRAEVVALHPFLSASQLKEATDRALIWRLADMHAPTYLDEQQRNWARHGLDEPLDPLEQILPPLPSERATCVATLTTAEVGLAAHFLRFEDAPELASRWLLDLATWRVATWRLEADAQHPERPLSDNALRSWRDVLVDAVRSQSDKSAATRQTERSEDIIGADPPGLAST